MMLLRFGRTWSTVFPRRFVLGHLSLFDDNSIVIQLNVNEYSNIPEEKNMENTDDNLPGQVKTNHQMLSIDDSILEENIIDDHSIVMSDYVLNHNTNSNLNLNNDRIILKKANLDREIGNMDTMVQENKDISDHNEEKMIENSPVGSVSEPTTPFCEAPISPSCEAPISPSCEMCRNYEVNLTKMQDAERNLKEQLSAAQHLADRYQNELSGERLYRKELEAKTSTLCSDTEREVKIANKGNEKCAEQLSALEEKCGMLIHEKRSKIHLLKERLRLMNKDMISLSTRYLDLLGANRKCAEEMQAQAIELPQDVDQLQFLCLQLREELIETRAAREHSEVQLRDEITMLQEQRREDEIEKRRIEHAFTEQVNGVNQELGLARSKLSSMQDVSSQIEEKDRRIVEYQKVIEELEKQVESMQTERKDLELTASMYKQKCTTLQHELDTSETVQKDFVKLSQNLQIELEKIRQAEQEVRWQFEEDVHVCNKCFLNFSRNRDKLHCRHCGKIFCSACLSAVVPSGPQRRPAKVCEVCHTLLSRDSAPFFSHNLSTSNS